jgi:sulfonate transport system permease protein
MVVLTGDQPKVVLAALSVFFTTLVGTVSGLRSADRSMLELVHVFGGTPRDALFKVRLTAALPSLFGALRIAAPASVLGAIVGEYMGGAETGLGLMLINSQQAMEIARTWSIAVVATVLAGIGYALTGAVARILTPWAGDLTVDLGFDKVDSAIGARGWSAVLLSILWSAAVILAAWWLLLKLLGVPPFIGKGPLDVWSYLTDPVAGAGNRMALVTESLITLRDGAVGLAAGTVAAVVVAIAFNIWPAVQRAFMGIALALRSVPLVAMAPLVVLVCGRGLTAILVIGGVITFFPTLVNLTLALASTPHRARDLMKVFGASRLDLLLKVQVPSALPALFASLRMAAPLAMTGAMMAAWLATGNGLGYAILTAGLVSDYEGLWARVALATVFSLLLYSAIGIVERLVLSAYIAGGAKPGRSAAAD